MLWHNWSASLDKTHIALALPLMMWNKKQCDLPALPTQPDPGLTCGWMGKAALFVTQTDPKIPLSSLSHTHAPGLGKVLSHPIQIWLSGERATEVIDIHHNNAAESVTTFCYATDFLFMWCNKGYQHLFAQHVCHHKSYGSTNEMSDDIFLHPKIIKKKFLRKFFFLLSNFSESIVYFTPN